MTLEDLVQKLAAEYRVEGNVDVHEDWKQFNVFLTEAVNHNKSVVQRPLGKALKKTTHDDQVTLGPEGEALRKQEKSGTDKEEDSPQIVVLASGNLGLIYGTRMETRVSLEEIESVYPGLLDGLAEHEGIGFVMVHSQEQGAVVIGAKGRNYLDQNRVEGEDPLDGFGDNAAQHLRRTDTFPNAPDILVNSFCDHESNEVAAFEELIGSHGGLGGLQTHAFVLYPADLPASDEPLVGAASVYELLKSWAPVVNKTEESTPTPA